MKKYLLTLSTLVILTANPSIGFSADRFTEEEMVNQLKKGEKLQNPEFEIWFNQTAKAALFNLEARSTLKPTTLDYLFSMRTEAKTGLDITNELLPPRSSPEFEKAIQYYKKGGGFAWGWLKERTQAILVKHKHAPLISTLLKEYDNHPYLVEALPLNEIYDTSEFSKIQLLFFELSQLERGNFDGFTDQQRMGSIKKYTMAALTSEYKILQKKAQYFLQTLRANPHPSVIEFLEGIQSELSANASAQSQGGESKNMFDASKK